MKNKTVIILGLGYVGLPLAKALVMKKKIRGMGKWVDVEGKRHEAKG